MKKIENAIKESINLKEQILKDKVLLIILKNLQKNF